jgi:hypothetical protein
MEYIKRYISLKRDDLIERKSDIDIDDITIADFKASSITMREIELAHSIWFEDEDGNARPLKQRLNE